MNNHGTAICITCSKPFQKQDAAQKYCSRRCGFDSHRTLFPIPCPQCGKLFTQKYKKHTYCSDECHYNAHRIKITCKRCGKEFITKTGHPRTYCSNFCHDSSNFRKVMKICKQCGKEFDSINKPLREFCSRSCASKNRTNPSRLRTCKVCQASFHAHSESQQYCSMACRISDQNKCKQAKAKAKIRNATCPTCGTVFTTNRINQIYCCHSCAIRRIKQGGLSDRDRKGVCQRARLYFPKYCAICGWQEAGLDAHHIEPVRNNGANILRNVILLCPNHHRLADKGKINKAELTHYWHASYDHIDTRILDG